jgi:hypothetical protein
LPATSVVLLAAIGIYGVTAYGEQPCARSGSASLGAQQARVRMVLRQGMMLTVIGAAIGLCWPPPPAMLGSLLFGVGPTGRSASPARPCSSSSSASHVLRSRVPRTDRRDGSLRYE